VVTNARFAAALAFSVVATLALILAAMNRYLVDLHDRAPRPDDTDQSPTVRAASAWADVVRRSLDAALAPRE
jgi:hypothetical protein